jgi:hypothetical protein
LGLSFFVYGIELRSMCLWHIGGEAATSIFSLAGQERKCKRSRLSPPKPLDFV